MRTVNPLRDLNACHEMEKVLVGLKLRSDYRVHLFGVCNKVNGWDYLFATDAQRCEAFLKTIGKWEDE